MKRLITLALALSSFLCFSQTDIIEMRSRNASLASYTKTSLSNKYDHVPSSFGLDPSLNSNMNRLGPADIPVFLSPKVFLDSVKNIPEKGVVFFISSQCEQNPLTENSINVSPCLRIADTIFSQTLFQLNSSLDSVKEVLQRNYSMDLISDSTRFIDFEDEQEVQSVEILPKEKENSIGWELLFMLITPLLFAFGMSKIIIPTTATTK